MVYGFQKLHLRLIQHPAPVVSPLNILWLVIRHRLQSIDNVHEFQPAVNILIVPPDPIGDVSMLDFLGTHVSCQEDAQVVGIDLPVRVSVNQTEDR